MLLAKFVRIPAIIITIKIKIIGECPDKIGCNAVINAAFTPVASCVNNVAKGMTNTKII